MNKWKICKFVFTGALMLSTSALSLPAVSQQTPGPCGTGGGSGTMSKGQMPMMGGGHMGMMGDKMGGGHMGMMGGTMGGGHMGMMGDMMGGGHMGMMGDMMGGGHMGMMKKFKMLGLTEEQEIKIDDIQHQLHKQHWAIMGQMIDVKAELRRVHAGDPPDAKAIGAVYGKMFDLKRQMIETTIEAKNNATGVLTEAQAAQMKNMKQRRKMMHSQGGMMQGQGGMMQGQGGMMQGQGGMMQ
ncbi:Spy/CpxP family protein refolding chaperone, partial [Pseudomonadota bacterium]